MKKVLALVFAFVFATSFAASNALATYDFGQLGSGDIYRVRNVSDNQTDFVKVADADLCETVQFKVRIHNGGPKTLTNVKVKASLSSGVKTSHSSTVTVTADNNREGAVATGTAGVNLSKAGSIAYVNGSTELLDANGSYVKNLDDAITGAGVNIGDVAVSLNNKRFVQFKAKISCPEVKYIQVCELASKKIVSIKETDFDSSKYSKDLKDCAEKPPVPGEIVVCEIATKKVITIKEDEFDSNVHSKVLTDCDKTPVTPAELPQTGSTGGVIAVIASLLVAAAAYAVNARRNVLS
ncbi:MAG TPA: LPXTG cell wall anchor domain-containing protein [Candidatus Saccharibacteria bacterium]|nr:LPXTG cell wall anchor domain-containing protein [Candidatus Saccharibacteria bacterium]